jgi:hypothetical protein
MYYKNLKLQAKNSNKDELIKKQLKKMNLLCLIIKQVRPIYYVLGNLFGVKGLKRQPSYT